MAIATINVSGIAALRYVLTANTQFYFTNALDGQKLRLTLQQNSAGGFTVSSGNTPGIMQPSATANDDSTQELCYDATSNSWAAIPQQLSPGSLVLSTTTTSTSLAWQKGLYAISGSAAVTLTITNPVAGPPANGGNDGEVMLFTLDTAHAHVITMATTQSVNKSSTSITTAGVVGDAVQLMAFGGNVYVIGSTGAVTLS